MTIKNFGHLLYYFWQKPQRLMYFLRYRLVSGVQVQINHKSKLIYVLNPKVATTTITFYLSGKNEQEISSARSHSDKQEILGVTHIVNKRYLSKLQSEGYFVFSFVRNPYARMVSFFKQKYVLQSNGTYFSRAFSQNIGLKKVKSFEEVVKKISSRPDCVSDTHFMSQASILYSPNQKGFTYDYIGKLENFEEDFSFICKKFGGELPVWKNRTSTDIKNNFEKIISPEIEELIFERFREDFELFGYKRLNSN